VTIDLLPMANRLADYIEEQVASFSVKDIYNALEIYTICTNDRCEVLKDNPQYKNRRLCPDRDICISKEKNNIRVQLSHYCTKGFIERSKRAQGVYRRVDSILSELDIIHADPGVFLDIKWPFRLERVIRVMPKELAVIAGATGAGKSAYLLNFCLCNLEKHIIHYFANTEMTASRIKKRLLDHPQIGGFNMSNFKAYERQEGFADVIKPDGINVIDYLETSSEDPKRVGDDLALIHNKLTDGLAFVAVQKKTNDRDQKGKMREYELGVGGEYTKRKAGIYLTIDHFPDNKLVIRKCRERAHDEINPNGMEWGFKLIRGIYFRDIVDPAGIPQEIEVNPLEMDF